MKTDIKKTTITKDFDTVKTFRAIKEKIAKDIADMNLEQIKNYLKDRKVRAQES